MILIQNSCLKDPFVFVSRPISLKLVSAALYVEIVLESVSYLLSIFVVTSPA